MRLLKSSIIVGLLFLLLGTASAQVLTDNNAGLPGLWAGSTAWGDYDGDGDADILLAGLTGSANNCVPIARVYRNDNGRFTNINAGLSGIYLGQATWGDYDGDGDLDIALSGLTDQSENLTHIYRNENGTFTRDFDQNLVPLRYSALAWGDPDADGDLDLAISGMSIGGNPRTILYRNTRINASRLGSPLGGRSVFEEDVPNTQRLINLNRGNLEWGDIDNDGDIDLAVSGFGTGGPRQAQIYRNQPTGTLIQDERVSDLEPVSIGDLAWGDYDNDGDLDLVLSGWSNEWEATLNLYTNAAGILRENPTFSAIRVVGDLAWGDYDNDGDLDLGASGQSSTSERFAYVLRNTAGTFTTDNTLNLEGLRGGDLAWADHDNDGDLDLLIAGENGQDVRKTTLHNNANTPAINTRPTPPDRFGTPIITGSTLTLNWNDGTDNQSNPSGLTYTLRIGTSPGGHDVFSGTASTGFGNVGGSKTVRLAIPLARDTYYWAVRAIDGGYLASSESQEERFSVQDLVNSVQALRPLQNSAMAWADYDNDGDLDLALSGRDADGISRSVLYRNSANILSENSNIGLQGIEGGDLAWGDFDNDGDLDLALTGGDAAGNRFTHLYRNRLDAQDFALNIDNVQRLPQLGSSSAAWGDIDNDGDIDLILMGNATGARFAGIFRNDAGSLFQDNTHTLTAMDNGKLALGDIDNDGDLDIAAIGQLNDQNEASLTVYTNNGGTLSPDNRSTLSGLLASSLSFGDYDNDGDLDLGTTGFNFTEGLVTRIYANNGSGLFTDAGITGLTGAAASDLAWGDVDNDGDLDLALVGQAATGQILQIFRNQNGSFETAAIDLLIGVDFATVTWADYDNDGDLDLASSGRTSVDANTFPPVTRVNDNLESRFNPNRNPTQPSGLTATSSGDIATLSWSPSTDLGITPDAALTYRLRVGTQPGGHQVRPGISGTHPGSVRNTMYRLQSLSSGIYFWSVRAIDNGLAASEWSKDASFIVDTERPVVDSIQVRPRVLRQGARATVLIAFNDEPAGMDNSVSPRVTLTLSGTKEPLTIEQVSYSGGLWIGEHEIDEAIPGGTIIVNVQAARDLKNNEMLPHQELKRAQVSLGNGGVVRSLDGVLQLVISPNILPDLADPPEIDITPQNAVSGPGGATQVGEIYNITTTPTFSLAKAATLIWSVSGLSGNSDRLSVYQLNNTTWTRLGGTFESSTQTVNTPIEEFGTYGLFEDATPGGGTAGISNLAFSNRAFTPGGTRRLPPPGAGGPPGNGPRIGGSLISSTDISFDLGAQATVRIEIYSRNGRLERILEPGRVLNPGSHVVTWDGRDHDNRIVTSGLYIVVINADGKKAHQAVAVVNN